jgi:hypothetical protein
MLTLRVCYKVDETIEQPYSNFLPYISEVCKGAIEDISLRT